MLVVADEYNHHADGEHPEPMEELKIENVNDIYDGVDALFGVDLRTAPSRSMSTPAMVR